MIAKIPIRILACALGLATLGTAATMLSGTPGRAQTPASEAPKGGNAQKAVEEGTAGPGPDVGSASEREERRAQAREDVASLEAFVKAKQSQLREADFRLQVSRAHLADLERQQKRGLTSAYLRSLAELSVIESETDCDTRSAELKATAIRRDRAKRRLALIERGGVPTPEAGDLPAPGERLSHLERETDRLRYEMDRTDKALRMHLAIPSN